MSDVVISVDKLSKLYRLGYREETPDTLVGNLFSWLKTPVKNFKHLRSLTNFNNGENSANILTALNNVSFDVKRGEVIGIIGNNGAGKSTLLKILSRITEPTSGRIVLDGSVGSLLEVGTGFHPELTGRDNIYMNGTILGLNKMEIDQKFDEIVDFSGVEKFLDTPVKRYSSGMMVRLAFSVAAHLNPEILIVDEVLAVGDVDFQNKCIGKMQSISTSEGRTVLFVSHNMGAVRSLCTRSIVLRNGEIVYDDSAKAGIEFFLGGMATKPGVNVSIDDPNRSGDGRVSVLSARILDDNDHEKYEVVAGENAKFEFGYINNANLESVDIYVTIFNQFRVPVTHLNTKLTKSKLKIKSKGCVLCVIPKLPLPLGRYNVDVLIRDSSGVCDHIPDVIVFTVPFSVFFANGQSPPMRNGAALVDHTWTAI